MDKAWFDSLPALCRNRKYAFEEMHALDLPSPRPVAVKVGNGHKKLPIDLWPAAEFLAAALQGEEVFECEACNIEAFLIQLLRKAVIAADVLGSRACLGHKGLLSLLAMSAKPSATMAKPRNDTARLTSVKNLKDAILDMQEMCVFSEAELAPVAQTIEADPAMLHFNVEEPEKVKADGCADASALQGAQMSLEMLSDGQACVNLSAEQNGAAEGQDECPMCHKQDCNAAATEAESEEEEPSEEVKTIPRAEPSPQETAKQRRRKKRRERLRQKANA